MPPSNQIHKNIRQRKTPKPNVCMAVFPFVFAAQFFFFFVFSHFSSFSVLFYAFKHMYVIKPCCAISYRFFPFFLLIFTNKSVEQTQTHSLWLKVEYDWMRIWRYEVVATKTKARKREWWVCEWEASVCAKGWWWDGVSKQKRIFFFSFLENTHTHMEAYTSHHTTQSSKRKQKKYKWNEERNTERKFNREKLVLYNKNRTKSMCLMGNAERMSERMAECVCSCKEKFAPANVQLFI